MRYRIAPDFWKLQHLKRQTQRQRRVRRTTVQDVIIIKKKSGQRIDSKLISVSRLMAQLKEMGGGPRGRRGMQKLAGELLTLEQNSGWAARAEEAGKSWEGSPEGLRPRPGLRGLRGRESMIDSSTQASYTLNFLTQKCPLSYQTHSSMCTNFQQLELNMFPLASGSDYYPVPPQSSLQILRVTQLAQWVKLNNSVCFMFGDWHTLKVLFWLILI